MTKHEIREAAFIILYQTEQTGGEPGELAELTSEAFDMPINKAVVSFAEKVWKKRDELDLIIAEYSPSRAVSRISKVNLAILRIGIYELIYEKDRVPPKVAINEAIELTKAYSDKSDKGFVNGVLNSCFNKKNSVKSYAESGSEADASKEREG